MSRILVISSFLAHGAIGLTASAAGLRALGHEAVALPTTVLSNHPGYPHHAGKALPPAQLADMLEALDANGMLRGIDAILTGYLPTAAHVAFAGDALARVREYAPDVLYVCDPVLGDDPRGLYIPKSAADAIASKLVPEAVIVTPNRFELSWLTGLPVANVKEAITAAAALTVMAVAATSIPSGLSRLETMIMTHEGVARATMKRRDKVPHGIGDLFAGLLTGSMLQVKSMPDALAKAHAILADVVKRSAGRDTLDLSPLTRNKAMA